MNNKGFSFVELLVAIAILGIVSLPIASSFALSAKTDAKARETYTAANAADDVMLLVAKSKGVPVSNDASDNPVPNHGIEIIGEPQISEGIEIYQLEYNGYNMILKRTQCGSVYRVDLTVNYSVAGDEMTITRKGVLPVV